MLDLHHALGRKQVIRPVQMRLEAHALLADFVELAKTEDLEATAVGEDGAAPVHKRVQTAHAVDELVAGPQVEVVGVGEYNLGAGFF